MIYVEAPQIHNKPKDENCPILFLAGGISNCPNWQADMVDLLKDENVIILNPRKKIYNDTPEEGLQQINWEANHLRKADAISFWFPKETLCPITLYELGHWSAKRSRLFVGIHQEYVRRFDMEIQTRIARPEVRIVSDLESLSKQIKRWLSSYKNTID